MSLKGRAKKFSDERLSYRSRLAARRLFVNTVGALVRLAARLYDAGARTLDLATTHGLDIQRAWDVRPRTTRRELPHAPPFGARDFLSLTDALDARRGAGQLSAPQPLAPDGQTRAADEQTLAAGELPTPARDGPTLRASVIVHAPDGVERTFQVLRSLVAEVDPGETEIVVVDDASTDETARLLAHFGEVVRVVRSEVSLGLVESRNRGAAVARGAHLVFLSNDAVVTRGWLKSLVETAEGDAKVGAVGSLLLSPDGRVREAGAIIWRTGEVCGYGRGKSAEDRRFTFAREVDYCSGASLLVRKDLFDRLGGFDPRYTPAGGYEDADICMGVRALGFKVIYQPLSRVSDDGVVGAGAGGGLGQGRPAGHAEFSAKWREALAREHLPPSAGDAEPAANRKWAAQVVVFDDLLPTPDRDAGSARMMFILRALSEWSHPVFVTTGKRFWPEYEKLLWREGIETARAVDIKRLLRRRKFRAVVLSRPAVAGALLELIRRADPELKIVYDMLDVHHLRAEREAALTGDARAAHEADTLRRLETRLARAADLVWCGSPPDKVLMARAAPGVPSVVIPTIHELHGRGRPFAGREHLLFVGNFRHRPNTDAVHFLAREVLPLIRRSLAGIELLVVGDNAPPEFAGYAADGVRLLGYVPDLDPLMAGCRVFVAPIRFGSGVNGKIGEALSYGLPVVTTTVGAEGWEFADGEQALIADDPAAFAAAVIRLYGDAALWQKLSDGGYRHVAENNTPEVVARVINDSLGAPPRGAAEPPRLSAADV